MATIPGAGTPPAGRGGRRSWPLWAGAAAVVLVLALATRGSGGDEPVRDLHLEALLATPGGFPPGWWSLDIEDGAASFTTRTGAEQPIGEVVRFDGRELELGDAPECDGGGGLYRLVSDGDAVRFEAVGPDACRQREEVLTDAPWRPYTPLPRTTAVPDARPVRVLADVPIEGRPTGLAVAAGSVWVAALFSPEVVGIDPATNTVTAHIDAGYAAEVPGLGAGEGALWVSNWRRDTVVRLDLATRRLTGTVDVGLDPPGDILVADGAVWATSAYDGTVVRIDAATGKFTDAIEVTDGGAGGPQELMAYEGDVLVTVPGANEIARVDPGTGAVSTFFSGRVQSRLAVTADAVWAVEGLGATWVTRIRTDGVADLRVGVGEGRRPRALAATDDTVWVVTERRVPPTAEIQLVRIDAATGEVVGIEDVGRRVRRTDLAVDPSGDVWMTTVDSVLRIDGSAG
jgi:streptogramin lyase